MGVTERSEGENRFPEIILASSSPRRRELLTQIGIPFRSEPPDIEEIQRVGESPEEFVQRMSREKAREIAWRYPDNIVLGSDTIVLLDDTVLGKPVDAADATDMLQKLSGNTHEVLTAFSLIRLSDETEITGLGRAEVTFRRLDDREIADYVAGGSPMDKAGSYGIQEDLGAVFIERISGDYYTIVGLPLMQVYCALQQLSP